MTPTNAPHIRKMRSTEPLLAPIVRSTAMSARLSFTSMISDETTLNAATSTIMPSTMNIVSFCTCSTPMMVSLACRQSRASTGRPCSSGASAGTTSSTWSGSVRRISIPVTASGFWKNTCAAGSGRNTTDVVVVVQPGIEDRHHLVGAHARDGAERGRRALRRDQRQRIADAQPIGTAPARRRSTIALSPVKSSRLPATMWSLIGCSARRSSSVDAAHQAAARAAAVGGQQHLPVQHRHAPTQRRGSARMRRHQVLIIVDLLAGIGLRP